MKTTIIISLAIIATITLALGLMHLLTDHSIKSEITIDAPREKVWETLMDHDSYGTWNPFITSIGGDTKPGKFLEVTIQGEGQAPMDFQPEVLVNDSNEEFRWVGKLLVKGIFDGEHYFILEPTADGKTKFTQGEQFTGVFTGLFMLMIKESTEKGFNSMNVALKERAEAQTPELVQR